MNQNRNVGTLADVPEVIDQAGLTGTRRRDMLSSINRICEMAAVTPANVRAEPSVLRDLLSRDSSGRPRRQRQELLEPKKPVRCRPAVGGRHRSLRPGSAKRHPGWGPLLEAVAGDQRLSNGLAAFANWCAGQGISPCEVDHSVIQRFLTWLETKTLHPKPRDIVRGVPKFWNEASAKFSSWPATKLTTLSFKTPPKHRKWSELGLSSSRSGRLSGASCQARPIR